MYDRKSSFGPTTKRTGPCYPIALGVQQVGHPMKRNNTLASSGAT